MCPDCGGRRYSWEHDANAEQEAKVKVKTYRIVGHTFEQVDGKPKPKREIMGRTIEAGSGLKALAIVGELIGEKPVGQHRSIPVMGYGSITVEEVR